MRVKLGMTPEDTVQYLNKKCGMLGISELDSDMRVLEKAISEGNEKAALAVEAAAYRIKKYIGSFAAALGGVDAIVFTGGIGENSSYMRRLVMEDMDYLGVVFDFEENEKRVDGLHVLSDPKAMSRSSSCPPMRSSPSPARPRLWCPPLPRGHKRQIAQNRLTSFVRLYIIIRAL